MYHSLYLYLYQYVRHFTQSTIGSGGVGGDLIKDCKKENGIQ